MYSVPKVQTLPRCSCIEASHQAYSGHMEQLTDHDWLRIETRMMHELILSLLDFDYRPHWMKKKIHICPRKKNAFIFVSRYAEADASCLFCVLEQTAIRNHFHSEHADMLSLVPRLISSDTELKYTSLPWLPWTPFHGTHILHAFGNCTTSWQTPCKARA